MDIVTYALLKGNVNNLADSIAGKYDPNTEYHAGQIVVYEYELKRALGTTTGEFDPTKWEDVKITDLLGGGTGESIIIRASSHKTVDTYEVPVLTDTQLTQAYNGVVAGKNVFIVDDLDTITSQVLDASSIDGIAVRVLFTDALILTYKENGVIESVNVKRSGAGTDVQINGTSITVDGVANIPVADATNLGVATFATTYGIVVNNKRAQLVDATFFDSLYTKGGNRYGVITTSNYDKAVKATLCDGVGTAWTTTEQQAAQERIGIFSSEGVTF